MKKLISMILAMVLCLSLGCVLISCEVEELPEGTEEVTIGPDGISKEEWQDAIANDNFTNVTIEYVLEGPSGEKQSHIVKITPDQVYREVTGYMYDEEFSFAYLFEDENAQTQRKMFIDVFLSLLAERENFVYDMENGVYNAPEEVSVDVTAGEGYTAKETMKNGQVKFGKDGSLEVFTCELTEAAYSGEELLNSSTYNVTWTFKDYGKTEITEENVQLAEKSNSNEEEREPENNEE